MDDDGDYFTWTLEEARAVLSPDELTVAAAYYDIGEVGDMHHNPAKNVLFVKTPVEQIAIELRYVYRSRCGHSRIRKTEVVRRPARNDRRPTSTRRCM